MMKSKMKGIGEADNNRNITGIIKRTALNYLMYYGVFDAVISDIQIL